MTRNRFTRRRFMHGLATTGAAVFAGPYILRAAEPNKEKLRIAFVGTGGRAANHVGALDLATETCLCYADADRKAWANIEKKLGQGKAPAEAKSYTDYRKMFDKHEKDYDAVFVAVPDNHHAPASMRALRQGKAVYCEKPLTWSIEEARAMAKLSREKKIPTQMGNQGHANEGNRRIVEWVRGGVIGDILEVHTWTNRPIWPQGNIDYKPAPAPETLDWEAWIGPAKKRPYAVFSKGPVNGRPSPFHPFNWRGWYDFGCGAIGDMGCHTWDSVFWSMAPDYPASVELLKIVEHTDETFPKQSIFRWNFPEKNGRKAFAAYWYDGGLHPEIPEEIKDDPFDYTRVGSEGGNRKKAEKKKNKKKGAESTNAGGGPFLGADVPEGKKDAKVETVAPDRMGRLAGSGNIYVGTKGKILVVGDYGNEPRIIPSKVHEQTQFPAASIPRSPGHREEFIMAARGEKPWDFPGSNFSGYASPITEVMLLGAIAQKIGQVGFKIECDPVKREILTKEAAKYMSREYHNGWEL